MNNEPLGPVRNNIAAVDVDGDRYCLDCAPHVISSRDSFGVQLSDGGGETHDDPDGEAIVDRLIDGDIYTFDMGGAVPVDGARESDIEHWHCGRSHQCVNAVTGDEYEHVPHDETIGVLLDV